MKKKVLIILVSMLIIISGIIGILIYAHTSEKKNEANDEKVVEELEKDVYNYENEDISQDKIETNDSYEQESEKNNTENKNNAQLPSNSQNKNKDVSEQKNQSTSSSANKTSNSSSNSSSSDSKVDSNTTSETKKEEPKDAVKSDSQIWQEFINDPDTIRLLWGHITDYTNSNQAENKMVELAKLGYVADWVKTCTYISTGEKCAYGVKATIPAYTCETNPQMNYEWWKYSNNVDIITYLKSIGYTCEGKSWQY